MPAWLLPVAGVALIGTAGGVAVWRLGRRSAPRRGGASLGAPGPIIPRPPTVTARYPVTDQVVGKYLLGEVLGRGGMATVYRARHRVLNRDVALKVLAQAIARALQPDPGRRFQSAGEMRAALEAPRAG